MSHNEIEYPTNGKDIEVEGNKMEERRSFMPGVRCAEHVEEELGDYSKETQFGWAVLFLLQDLEVELTPRQQDHVVSNTKQIYECLKE